MICKIVFIWLDIYTQHNIYVKIPNLYNLTVNQAKDNLTKLGLIYEIDTSHYNPKYVPYHIYNFTPQAGGLVKPGRVIFIQVNANTFNFTKIPNIILKNKHFALSRLYAQHFLVKNIIYVPQGNKGLILKIIHNNKFVHPGDILPYRSELYLVVGNGITKNRIIPNLIGMNLTDAKILLERKKIIINQIFYDQNNNNIVNNKIYRQEPKSGSFIDEKEQAINLWVMNNPEYDLNNNSKDRQQHAEVEYDKTINTNEQNKEILIK